MSTTELEVSQEFLDENNFSLQSIRRFERYLGQTWLSPGGEAQARTFLETQGLVPHQRVLDLGSGPGGAAFLMARCYGVHVHGIDISVNMNQIALDYLSQQEKKVQDLVQFEVADMEKMQMKTESYDVIHSRDAILYVDDKESFFKKIQGWLRPGGRLFVTDFCRGTNEDRSQEHENLMKTRRWSLRWTVAEYEEALRKAGFKNVRARDMSDVFLQLHTKQLESMTSMRECIIQDFGREAYDLDVSFWKTLVAAAREGTYAWGVFEATK